MLTQTTSSMRSSSSATTMPRPEALVSRAAIQYPLEDQLPDTGQTVEVAPGVFWLRMGLPFALNHINLWMLRDQLPHPTQPGKVQEGWTLIDCGIDNPATREAWLQLESHALQGLPVLRVLVTHMHPDHMGLAHWLCERWQAPLWISTSEYQSALLACSGLYNFASQSTTAFYASHGWQQAKDPATGSKFSMGLYASMVPKVPTAYVRLMAGASLRIGDRTWRCLGGYGHSPEHIALHDTESRLLISGDMLLPSISTNISVTAREPDGNPLAWFLASLDEMADLPDATLVLPSHGRPFTGAATRVAQLKTHHAERLAELLQACAQTEHCAHELLLLIFKRPLDSHQTTFAMGEAVAHLNLLWLDGKLQRRLDDEGVYRFKTAQS